MPVDFVTLIFIAAAVIVFFQLRSVLGKRTGHQPPPFDPISRSQNNGAGNAEREDNVVELPRREEERAERYGVIDRYAPEGTDLNKGLRGLLDLDGSFDPRRFVDGAKMAYEMIVTAFAGGDKKSLAPLLSDDVYSGFSAAIDSRNQLGHEISFTFVGINEAQIVDANLNGKIAELTVKIAGQMISATKEKSGDVVDGSLEDVVENHDIWTFARDLSSHDPNWKLIATEAED